MNQTKYLLIGGMSPAYASVSIREEDQTGAISIVGQQPAKPYDHPPLSKDFLQNPNMKEDDPECKMPNYYPDNNILLFESTEIDHIDPIAHIATAKSGELFQYEKVLIATGSSPIKPPIPGLDLPGVFMLRTIFDAVKIRNEIQDGKKALCIGTGFIGLEVAASLKQRGMEVVVAGDSLPYGKFENITFSEWMIGQMEKNGVPIHCAERLTKITQTQNGLQAEFESGLKLEANMIVAGLGAKPNLDLPKSLGLEMALGGVKVSSKLETSVIDVYACGDIATFPDPSTGELCRVEHHMNAKWQSQTVGKVMSGHSGEYKKIAYFWSDVFDVHLGYRGNSDGASPAKNFGSMDDGRFVDLWARPNGEIASGLIIWDDYEKIDPISDKLEVLLENKKDIADVEPSDLGL